MVWPIYIDLANQTSYAMHLDEGLELGTASEAVVVSEEGADSASMDEVARLEEIPYIKKVCEDKGE